MCDDSKNISIIKAAKLIFKFFYHHGKSLEILRGREVSNPKFFKGKYEAKIGIFNGVRRGPIKDTFHSEGYRRDIFWTPC